MQKLNPNFWSIQCCTCNGNFPGFIFDGCKVGRTPSTSNDDEEEGGGDEAVEDQDEEDQHIVRLQIFRQVIYSSSPTV